MKIAATLRRWKIPTLEDYSSQRRDATGALPTSLEAYDDRRPYEVSWHVRQKDLVPDRSPSGTRSPSCQAPMPPCALGGRSRSSALGTQPAGRNCAVSCCLPCVLSGSSGTAIFSVTLVPRFSS
ncbi:hypothetical protein BRADI_3g09575v3 [Brachypodium distachyon]|uniref:Uncharacterized protein n=1 Tax=Brachypodium distachyon TaxID=15368 RepID=A0A2K2CW77_BRADI|nr:hypothetical protein BRADI_3g09575v3 [Brachypodium distachyon]